MHFSLTEEQRLIVDTTRDFVVNELYPHEAEVEATGCLRPELRDEIKRLTPPPKKRVPKKLGSIDLDEGPDALPIAQQVRLDCH